MFLVPLTLSLSLLPLGLAANFDWENIRLTSTETSSYPAIRFASQPPPPPISACRTIPGDSSWPSEAEWAKFNDTLGGVLLKPRPLAVVCYTGDQYDSKRCEELKQAWGNTVLHSNDPTSIMSQWASGNTCVPTAFPNSTCTQGGYPVYVVKATTVRHVQLAVNFARNMNIRLVVKTSGHDFNGKSIGGHALSIWTHDLKSLTYHPNYTSPSATYTGRAVALGAGIRAADGYTAMSQYNMTMIVAGGSTVGLTGGYMQGGGHSSYTSFYGLVVDNVFSIQAVLASGEFVTLSKDENSDLFWAFRGGGGSTFGVVTSMVVKVFPVTPLVSSSITFSTLPARGSNSTGLSVETFWKGVQEYLAYCVAICDAGGLGYNFIRHATSGNTTGLTFTTSISLPNKTRTDYQSFIRPLLLNLSALGIPVVLPPVKRFSNHVAQDELYSRSLFMPNSNAPLDAHDTLRPRALGDTVSQTLIASRFFLRSNHASPAALSTMNAAIRALVEDGGYTFHGINHNPNLNVSGHPDNAVNPAWRQAILHAQGYEGGLHWDGKDPVGGRKEWGERWERLQSYMQKWRDVTPNSGSYINEGDAQDPSWKSAFFGRNYGRLLAIKHARDPWGVFWAMGAVAHDEWVIRSTSDEEQGSLVMQDGRLCRVKV